ncbi:hypothetical protein [Psychromonas sp. psych-6C06]|nr:hypothetical protein [Psychromonas sp. psych-6C06]
MQRITTEIEVKLVKQAVQYNKQALLKLLAPKHGKVIRGED